MAELEADGRGHQVTNESLYQRGLKVIPGGVNSPVRAFRSVGGTPYFVARGEGAYVWDVEGTRFTDYVQSYGASILGHANETVIAAVRDAALRGTTFGAPTEGEVRLAETLCERVPGMEQVRLVSSGTEAAMSALRLARGVTGRDKVIKFAGHYHGHSDALLAAGGSGVADQGLSGSAGVIAGAVGDTVVAPWHVLPCSGHGVAAVGRLVGGVARQGLGRLVVGRAATLALQARHGHGQDHVGVLAGGGEVGLAGLAIRGDVQGAGHRLLLERVDHVAVGLGHGDQLLDAPAVTGALLARSGTDGGQDQHDDQWSRHQQRQQVADLEIVEHRRPHAGVSEPAHRTGREVRSAVSAAP